MTTEQERADFEAWCAKQSPVLLTHVWTDNPDRYASNYTQVAWEAYQAGRASMQPTAKIDPNPPSLSIIWHDSPESVYRAMWEQAAIEAGVSYEELIEGSNVGETEDGEVFEFTHEQAIEGMRTQGCWGFVDTKTNTINAWAADDVDAPTALHFLAHEIGHVTGEQLDDDMQEEMRAEQFGRVAVLAYRMWCEKNNDAPQPAEPVKVPSNALINATRELADWAEHEAGADLDLTPGLAAVRALLARYGKEAT